MCVEIQKGSVLEQSAPVPDHVLAVDDDPLVRQLVSDYLSDNGYRVTTAATGSEMFAILEREAIELLVLDLRLAFEDGLVLARQVREQSSIPIIVLTARKDEADRVMSLELGVDDYLTKPFSPRELLARIRALLRRARMHETVADTVAKIRAYRFAGWELNVRVRRLTSPTGEEVPLSNGEFNLLVAFLAAPGRVLGRTQLLELSRLHNAEVFERSIDVQVGRLRKKIEPTDASPRLIVTERGAGYVFSAKVEVTRA